MATSPTATADSILDAAQRIAQAVGYNGLSFRDVAAAVGIKSSSVHYHFPSKGQLGAAVARRYTDRLISYLQKIDSQDGGANAALEAYVAAFRTTLEQDGRMCLCGMLAAEADSVPPEVHIEVQRFVRVNVQWIGGALERATGAATSSEIVRQHATALFAALEGAMLVARASGDIADFDSIAAQLGRLGLIPQSPGRAKSKR